MLKNNRDFLLIDDARLCNPNGNPDDENRPRMDDDTQTLLVSDVRVKRTLRDFAQKKGFPIFVATSDDKKVTMENRLKAVLTEYGVDADADEETKLNAILDNMIDIRMFGSAMAVDGITRTFTGPIQISWGYSLHPVDLVKANSISSIMSSNESTEGYSTFGQMQKAEYAMIAHNGSMNKFAASKTRLTQEDADLFPRLLVQSMMNNQTHSKQGQQPLLYLEVEYAEAFDGFLGDLRRYLDITLHKKYAIRSGSDLTVDFSRLSAAIADLKEKGYVTAVRIWMSPLQPGFTNLPQDAEQLDLFAPISASEKG